MSTLTKLRMLQNALITRDEQERKARKLLSQATCPLVAIYAATGAPSTESSWTCCFQHGIPGLDLGCPVRGIAARCRLLGELRQHHRLREFLALRDLQLGAAAFTPHVAGLLAWYELEESPPAPSGSPGR